MMDIEEYHGNGVVTFDDILEYAETRSNGPKSTCLGHCKWDMSLNDLRGTFAWSIAVLAVPSRTFLSMRRHSRLCPWSAPMA